MSILVQSLGFIKKKIILIDLQIYDDDNNKNNNLLIRLIIVMSWCTLLGLSVIHKTSAVCRRLTALLIKSSSPSQ